MSKENLKDTVDPIVEYDIVITGPIIVDDAKDEDTLPLEDVEDEIKEDDNVVYGEVSKCSKLNVREKPEPNAKVVCMIDVGTELMIDMTNSIGKWFKIYTESGVEGYCMNDFITIK